jgi:hypothetical protein
VKITPEELDTLTENPLTDELGNIYWEWPVNAGRHLVWVYLIGEEESVTYGIWDAGTPKPEAPLYREISHLRGRAAAVALIKRWRTSDGDERFVRTVLAGLGISSRG